MKVAIVGSGIAGLGAARALDARHQVELFEAAPRPGGHTNTIPVGGLAVDTGFIIYNQRTYPRLTRLFAELAIATRATDMSFSCSCARCDLEYGSSNVRSLFAQRRNWLRPQHYRLLGGVLRFFRLAHAELRMEKTNDRAFFPGTLGEWAARRRVSDEVMRHFVVPMGAAIWSTAPARMLDFPARTFVLFFANHGMLGLTTAPTWRTVVGGSQSYVRALLAQLRARVHLSTPVRRVTRDATGVTLELPGGPRRFDRVVLATHADTSLALLGDPTSDERRLLGAIRYTTNDTYLHTDATFMPSARAAWSAWNQRHLDCRGGGALEATYWMNRLQGLPGPVDYLVTLNPTRPIRADAVITRIRYEHPLYDFAALNAQAELGRLQGRRGTYYCGAWQGYGFHEDGLRAGQEAAAALDADAARTRGGEPALEVQA